jgi:hypothetical protein
MAVPGLPGYVADVIAAGLAGSAVLLLRSAWAPHAGRVPLFAGVSGAVSSGYASLVRDRR